MISKKPFFRTILDLQMIGKKRKTPKKDSSDNVIQINSLRQHNASKKCTRASEVKNHFLICFRELKIKYYSQKN